MGVKLVLKSSGPGLFLIAFGIVLLLVLANRTAVLSDTTSASSAKPTSFTHSAGTQWRMLQVAGEPSAGNSTPAADCVIRSRRREFATGTDLLGKENLQSALSSAIDGLIAAGKDGIPDAERRADVVQTLRALREAAKEE